MSLPLDKWTRGEVPTAAKLNQPVDALNQIASMMAADGSGLTISDTAHGRTISLDTSRGVADEFLGYVVTAGPSSEADFDDQRYWVRRAFINSQTIQLDALTIADDTQPSGTDANGNRATQRPEIVTAWNLAEFGYNDHSSYRLVHALQTTTSHPVIVRGYYDRSTPPSKHYVFSSTSFKIDEEEIGIGGTSEGGTSEDSETWDIYTDLSGPSVWVMSRVVYAHAGDEILYGYRRQLKFDRGGRLYAITAETRFEIDAPVDCP
jgi:hypothetical protein